MKQRLIYTGILLSLSIAFYSCEKDYEVYNAKLSAVRFAISKGVDSLVYSFALKPEIEEDMIEIPIKLLGFTSQERRKVNIITIKESTTAQAGTHFDLLPCSIESGNTTGVQKVKIHKTNDLKEKKVKIALLIIDSPDLAAGPINERNYRIIITNKLTKPEGWLNNFGDYSEVKHRFIIEVTGKGTNYSNDWSGMEIIHWMGVLNKALYEYNRDHPDTPMKDENNVLITFPII